VNEREKEEERTKIIEGMKDFMNDMFGKNSKNIYLKEAFNKVILHCNDVRNQLNAAESYIVQLGGTLDYFNENIN